MSSRAQQAGHVAGDVVSAYVVLSLIGFPAIVVFAIGVGFLLWVARLCWFAIVVVALTLRWLRDTFVTHTLT